jgi:DNA-binding LacI/PurR family transcriptional regulator
LGNDEFACWFHRWRPEAIVVQSLAGARRAALQLEELGCKVPDDVAIAVLGVDPTETFFAGVDEKGYETGVAAVDLLVSLIHGNERGIPETIRRLLIEGVWKQNESVRRVNAEKRD